MTLPIPDVWSAAYAGACAFLALGFVVALAMALASVRRGE